MTTKELKLFNRAIDHPIRSRIIDMLHTAPGMSVTELFIALRLEQTVVSQHLAVLRQADVASSDRTGRNITYALTPKYYEITQKIAAL